MIRRAPYICYKKCSLHKYTSTCAKSETLIYIYYNIYFFMCLSHRQIIHGTISPTWKKRAFCVNIPHQPKLHALLISGKSFNISQQHIFPHQVWSPWQKGVPFTLQGTNISHWNKQNHRLKVAFQWDIGTSSQERVNIPTHTIHVWYIYLHLAYFDGKSGEIYHTWMLLTPLNQLLKLTEIGPVAPRTDVHGLIFALSRVGR